MEAVRLNGRREYWKDKYRTMRNAFVTTFVVLMCVVLGCIAGLVFVRSNTPPLHITSDTSQVSYDVALASVRVANGGLCSGEIVSPTGYGLSAAHCFLGRIGGQFWVYRPDGKAVKATLLEHDRSVDLAMFKIAQEDVLAWIEIKAFLPENGRSFEAVGYPGGEGPNYKQLSHPNREFIQSNGTRWRWSFDVNSGYFGKGDSGGMVVMDGHLLGVISDQSNDKHLYASTHPQVVEFVRKRCKKDAQCDIASNWNEGGEVAPPPPVEEPAPAPAPKGQPPKWTPRPNVPLDAGVPKYNGKGPRPPQLDSDKDLAHQISRLAERLAALENTGGRQGEKGEKGERGERGPAGERGKDGSPGPAGLTPDVDLRELKIADQRMAGDIDAQKRELASLKNQLDSLNKEVKNEAIERKDAEIVVRRLSDRVAAVEKKLSGSMHIRVRRDPNGNVAITQPEKKE